MGKSNFRELQVWQRGKELAVLVYGITASGKLAADFGLRDQIRRSAVSVPSNIAEGNELGTDREAIRHFFIARGSAGELLTQLIIAQEVGYLDPPKSHELETRCIEISRMLARLIAARATT